VTGRRATFAAPAPKKEERRKKQEARTQSEIDIMRTMIAALVALVVLTSVAVPASALSAEEIWEQMEKRLP
jgi:hypothetical protein